MAEYIEREALLKDIENDKMTVLFDKTSAIHHVKNQPAADVAEVRHGKWVNDICSVCERVNPTITEDFCGNYISKPLAYCPHCGAKMGDDEE